MDAFTHIGRICLFFVVRRRTTNFYRLVFHQTKSHSLLQFQIPLNKRNCTILAIMAQIKNLPEGITAQIFRYCLVIFACNPDVARGVWVCPKTQKTLSYNIFCANKYRMPFLHIK